MIDKACSNGSRVAPAKMVPRGLRTARLVNFCLLLPMNWRGKASSIDKAC